MRGASEGRPKLVGFDGHVVRALRDSRHARNRFKIITTSPKVDVSSSVESKMRKIHFG